MRKNAINVLGYLSYSYPESWLSFHRLQYNMFWFLWLALLAVFFFSFIYALLFQHTVKAENLPLYRERFTERGEVGSQLSINVLYCVCSVFPVVVPWHIQTDNFICFPYIITLQYGNSVYITQLFFLNVLKNPENYTSKHEIQPT